MLTVGCLYCEEVGSLIRQRSAPDPSSLETPQGPSLVSGPSPQALGPWKTEVLAPCLSAARCWRKGWFPSRDWLSSGLEWVAEAGSLGRGWLELVLWRHLVWREEGRRGKEIAPLRTQGLGDPLCWQRMHLLDILTCSQPQNTLQRNPPDAIQQTGTAPVPEHRPLLRIYHSHKPTPHWPAASTKDSRHWRDSF